MTRPHGKPDDSSPPEGHSGQGSQTALERLIQMREAAELEHPQSPDASDGEPSPGVNQQSFP